MSRSSTILLLALIMTNVGTACVRDVWTGRRCADEQVGCENPDGATDGGLDAARRDAAPTVDAACPLCDASVASPSRCVPGRYEGDFSMSYRSGPGGLCGIVAQVNGAYASGRWTFELPATVDQAQRTLALDRVCLLAGADAEGSTSDAGTPLIRARLTGTLDCATGELRSTIEGTYAATSVCDLGVALTPYFVRGSVSGTYDVQSHAFTAGLVSMREPAVLVPPQPGGDGTWRASRVSDVVDAGDLSGDCLGGVVFPDAMFTDAGP